MTVDVKSAKLCFENEKLRTISTQSRTLLAGKTKNIVRIMCAAGAIDALVLSAAANIVTIKLTLHT